ncbi:hypothetical protein, variant [Verruconis gallopava]|uniref:MARVEL domain-containing protein n=1 Tax=Verruconis gallopava TaxID=253628 RepID=A0A0D2A4P3_9PEZI|nr:uncharacterized protein PV09_07194 [Verruconis gallopava]XP_016211305.1 hypothetical protein, variant [Verruconis gallopava]KIW01435.1 hypothetical protein PV09_07194 [Verruconis gallopava]KIW01436.1 hypothetical protein, variant [Verruconis gallopava]
MPTDRQTPPPQVVVTQPDTSKDIRTPRTARFAEATAVYSPIEPSEKSNPFADPPTNHYVPQAQPSDIGFGYLREQHISVEMEETDPKYLPPPTPKEPLKSPLKSALKSPGAPPKNMNAILSPTFREEEILEKAEADTEKEQEQDLKVKTRVRVAKFVLRGVNFSCSLIVLSMLSTTFAIFNATKSLPPRNNLPPWSSVGKVWPQVTLLVIACISLFLCMVIFYGYWKGGHRRAEKVAVYYTTFAVGFFIFSIVMWGVGAVILNQSKANGKGQDIWGWSCNDNTRRALFQDDVAYALICRLQNWSLVCCIIEVVVEVFTIAIYGVVFYRFYSKRKLRKSMAIRDRARSDLYLAQLRSQSVPNTPGGPLSPRDGGWRPPVGHPLNKDSLSQAEKGESEYFARKIAEPQPFQLMPAPTKAKPAAKPAFAVPEETPSPSSPLPLETRQAHAPTAEGETQYGEVAIPGAYATPSSPGFAPAQPAMGGFDFGLQNQR